jgi:hypothetical protein
MPHMYVYKMHEGIVIMKDPYKSYNHTWKCDYFVQLTRLEQTSTIEDYISKFEELIPLQ